MFVWLIVLKCRPFNLDSDIQISVLIAFGLTWGKSNVCNSLSILRQQRAKR